MLPCTKGLLHMWAPPLITQGHHHTTNSLCPTNTIQRLFLVSSACSVSSFAYVCYLQLQMLQPPCWWLKEQLFILTGAWGLSGPGLIQLALISVYRLEWDLLSMLVFILIQSQGWPWHFLLMAERWEGPARLYQQLSSLCFCQVCYYPIEQSRSRGQTQHQWSRKVQPRVKVWRARIWGQEWMHDE